MAPETTPPLPGSLTVFPEVGWQLLLTFLAASVVVGVLYLAVTAAGRGVDGRPEWQAWLDSRSRPRGHPDDLIDEE